MIARNGLNPLLRGYPSGVSNATAPGRAEPTSGDSRLRRSAATVAGNLWGDRGARTGLAFRGLVYLLLGYLIARIADGALGGSGTHKTASGPGVAQAVAAQPGGRALLVVLGAGLVLYAMFSLLDAVLHHDDEEPTAKRWGDRFLSAWGCFLYGAFGIYCFVTAASSDAGQKTASQSDHTQTRWSAEVLDWPAGWFYLGGLGIVLLVIAAFLVSRCVRMSFRTRLRRESMSRRAWAAAVFLAVLGYLGRAGVFALVGVFVLGAAIRNDPRQGNGVDGSARSFAQSAAGPYLLWTLAAALFGYGVYMFFEARYRKV